MKRVKSKLITTLLAVAMAFSLTACGEKPCKHTYDDACDAICNKCSAERTVTHTPEEDDGSCLTEIICSDCGTVTTEAKQAHTPNDDDGDCTTAITCSDCETVTTEARTAHEGGTATCVNGKLCDFCDVEYDTVKNPENHVTDGYEYVDNGNGSHRINCQCGELLNECEWCDEAGMDAHTGKCRLCDSFIACVSVTTADGVKTYYEYLEDAMNEAVSLENSTVLVEDECVLSGGTQEINSGNFTIDLGGNKVSHHWTQGVFTINGGNVVIKDSVGEGKVDDGITLNSGSLTLQSGSFSSININCELYTPADILADGYCFYDSDGNEVDISKIGFNGGCYYLEDVTVGEIKQN